MACASTVAVVVPSPATSDVLLATSYTICAPMFSSASLRSISFATVTPSLVMVGDPNFLSRITFRPRGPSVTLTALAKLFTPRRIPCREASPYTICFAIRLSRFLLACFDDRQHFVLAHDEVLLTINVDVLTRILAEQDYIARLYIERDAHAALFERAVARGDHRASLRLLLRGVRDNDSAALLLTFFVATDDDSIVERSDILKVHLHSKSRSRTRVRAILRPTTTVARIARSVFRWPRSRTGRTVRWPRLPSSRRRARRHAGVVLRGRAAAPQ